MTSLDFARVRRLVEEAHALPPAEREAFLARACGPDTTLLAEVEALLSAADRAPGFLEPDARAQLFSELERELGAPGAGLAIGGYRLVRRIASGGMGTVWEAEQDEPRRKVALKMLRTGLGSREAVRRFRHEAQILARLRHPCVAQVYASGVLALGGEPQGLPWFAMEYVEGARTLLEHARSLPLEARLQLFVELCGAVQHGHERGVIHRDIKPGNVLVDSAGRLKVIDFGVARISSAENGTQSQVTEEGRVIGTLQYMSPEQIAGASDGLDTRSDVYALGVVLYELLTGEQPYELTGVPLPEVARILQERTPPRPSARRTGLATDLDAIVLKAMEKERERRYASAAAFAADVGRFLRHEPVEAHTPSVAYQLRAFARRNRALVGALAAVLLILVAATAVSLAFAWRATSAEKQTRERELEAIRQRDATAFREYTANVSAAYGAIKSLDVVTARQRLEACPEDLRGFEWKHLYRRLDGSRWTRATGRDPIFSLCWLADGGRILAGVPSGELELREAATGRLLERVPSSGFQYPTLLATADGRKVVAVCSGGWVRVFATEPFRETFAWRAAEEGALFGAVGCDPDVLATCSRRGEIRLWDLASGALLGGTPPVSGSITCMAVCLERRLAALGTSTSSEVLVADLDTGAILHRLRSDDRYVSSVIFAAGGTRLVSSSHDHKLRLWDVDSGELLGVLQAHTDLVWNAALSPTDARVASCSWDRTLRLWNTDSRTLIATLIGHTDGLQAVAFAPDGRSVLTGDESGHIKSWSVDPPDPDVIEVRGKWLWTLRFFPDGGRLLAIHGGFATVFDAASGTIRAEFPYAHGAEWRAGAPSPDGAQLALGDAAGQVEIRGADGALPARRFRTAEGACWSLDWSDDGGRIAVGSLAGAVGLFDREGGRVAELESAAGGEAILAIEPGGARLAVSGRSGRLELFDARSGALVHRTAPLGAPVRRLAWSRAGDRLALALGDGRVLLWNPRTLAAERELDGHEASVEDVAFSPDGARLASCGIDRSVRLWELPGGREVAAFSDHSHYVDAVAFDPAGVVLASGSSDSTLRFWRSDASGSVVLPPEERAGEDALEAWRIARSRDAPRSALERARAQAAAALRVLDADPLATRALAAATLRLGDGAQALAILERRCAAEPEDATAHALRGLALARAGRIDDARAELALAQAGGRTPQAADPDLRRLRDELGEALVPR